jgi:hypothetical protein
VTEVLDELLDGLQDAPPTPLVAEEALPEEESTERVAEEEEPDAVDAPPPPPSPPRLTPTRAPPPPPPPRAAAAAAAAAAPAPPPAETSAEPPAELAAELSPAPAPEPAPEPPVAPLPPAAVVDDEAAAAAAATEEEAPPAPPAAPPPPPPAAERSPYTPALAAALASLPTLSPLAASRLLATPISAADVAPLLESTDVPTPLRDAAIEKLASDYRAVLAATVGSAEEAKARLRSGLRDDRRWAVIQADDVASERCRLNAQAVGTVLAKKAPPPGGDARGAGADGLYPLTWLVSTVAWPADVVRASACFCVLLRACLALSRCMGALRARASPYACVCVRRTRRGASSTLTVASSRHSSEWTLTLSTGCQHGSRSRCARSTTCSEQRQG